MARDTRLSKEAFATSTPSSHPETQEITSDVVVNNRVANKFIERLREGVLSRTYPVDYGKSYFEVCKDFVDFTIKNSKSLDIICRPWAPEPESCSQHDVECLPSWILTLNRAPFGSTPNDGRYIRINADPLVGQPDERRYSATFDTHSSHRIDTDSNSSSMFVEGFILDKINMTETEAIGGIIPGKWPVFGGWKDRTAAPPEEFWRTLIADRSPTGENPPSYFARACVYAFGRGVPGEALNIDQVITSGIGSIGEEFLRRVQHVVWGRKLMRTKHYKLLGLAPEIGQKGDSIAILYGCSVPVVLRRKIGSDYYTLVGECYVHGMMDGEAFDFQKSAQTRAENARNNGLAIPDLCMTKQTFELR